MLLAYVLSAMHLPYGIHLKNHVSLALHHISLTRIRRNVSAQVMLLMSTTTIYAFLALPLEFGTVRSWAAWPAQGDSFTTLLLLLVFALLISLTKQPTTNAFTAMKFGTLRSVNVFLVDRARSTTLLWTPVCALSLNISWKMVFARLASHPYIGVNRVKLASVVIVTNINITILFKKNVSAALMDSALTKNCWSVFVLHLHLTTVQNLNA